MPPQLERNSPCPCGSGKKYKKCCQLGLETGTLPAEKIQAITNHMLKDMNDPEWVRWFAQDWFQGQRNKEEYEKTLPPPK